jgi:hypothetical protein
MQVQRSRHCTTESKSASQQLVPTSNTEPQPSMYYRVHLGSPCCLWIFP